MHHYSSRKKCSARSCFVQESLKHGSPLVRTAAVKAAAELATGSEFVSTHGVAVAARFDGFCFMRHNCVASNAAACLDAI